MKNTVMGGLAVDVHEIGNVNTYMYTLYSKYGCKSEKMLWIIWWAHHELISGWSLIQRLIPKLLSGNQIVCRQQHDKIDTSIQLLIFAVGSYLDAPGDACYLKIHVYLPKKCIESPCEISQYI